LSAAWVAAYGRHAIASRAYSEAIKAVEAASIPVVLPGQKMVTLGKVIRELRDHPDRFQLVINAKEGSGPADISAVHAMLSLLWEGQTDRHGAPTPTVPVTPEAAAAAVHLAVTLVQWFQSGAVQGAGKSPTRGFRSRRSEGPGMAQSERSIGMR
jgi:hypothetical protein